MSQRGRALLHGACWVCVLLGGMFVTWTSIERRERPWDDELITLTYAKNIAAGRGFVYNHPPATLGTTTPLVAIAIGLLGRIFPSVDLVYMAVSLSSTCCVGVGWLLFLNRRVLRLRDYEAAMLALVFFVFTRHAIYFNVGLEYPPFQFLLLAAILLFLHGRMLSCGIVIGLLFLVRGEGALLLPMLGIAHLIRTSPAFGFLRPRTWPDTLRNGWRGVLAMGIGFTVVFGLWAAYALPTFGTVLPNTLRAKLLQGEALGADAPRFLAGLIDVMPEWGRMSSAPLHFWSVHVLAIFGLIGLLAMRSPLRLLLAWGLLYTVAYTLLGVPACYTWYQIPVYYTWLLCVGAGLLVVARGVRSISRIPMPVRIGLMAAILLGLLAPVSLQLLRSAHANGGDPRAKGYGAIAKWLRENADPQDGVAVMEVGFMGYYTDSKILDLAGLVSPEILDMLASPEKPDVLLSLLPEYYVQVRSLGRDDRHSRITLGSTMYRRIMRSPLELPMEPYVATATLYKKTPFEDGQAAPTRVRPQGAQP